MQTRVMVCLGVEKGRRSAGGEAGDELSNRRGDIRRQGNIPCHPRYHCRCILDDRRAAQVMRRKTHLAGRAGLVQLMVDLVRDQPELRKQQRQRQEYSAVFIKQNGTQP